MAVGDGDAEALTHAGFPNPHKLASVGPSPCGPPVSLGPLLDAAEPRVGVASGQRRHPLLPPTRAVAEAPPPVAAAPAAGQPALSEQVLRQKAKIAELIAAEAERKEKEAALAQETAADEDEDDEDEETDIQRRLENLMASVQPCAAAYPSALAQASDRLRVEATGGRWCDLKGLRLVVRPAREDDCVLLVASCLHTSEGNRETACCALTRGGAVAGPRFAIHSGESNCSTALCLPYLDQPGKKMDLEYTVAANTPGSSTRFMVSAERQRRQLLSVTLPTQQCAWLEDDERLCVEPGQWGDLDGFYEVVTTLPGEKVLVLSSIQYTADWGSELNRGRFTLVRDDVGLDGLHDRGLQSVRALAPGLRRTLVMAAVDEPAPGPHIYRARAALTASSDTGVSAVVQGDRQLSLIRLPGNLVVGPCSAEGPVTIDEPRWTEIPGLSVTVSLRRPRDRVLLVYHTDCHPTGFSYEAHFTVLRRTGSGPSTDLGYPGDFGTDMVSSAYAASSEYPTGLLCDAPGTLGPHTYVVAARVANTGTSSDNPPVVVGYSGALSAVLLPAR